MIKKFDEVFVDKTRLGKKIPKEEYKKKGKYIIIDQGKDKIAGFTDNEDGIFTDVPTIIFGDHTRIIKYIDKPFFLGADGVKVLKSKINNANYKYLYYALKAAYIPNTGYNRHFKWLKKVSINYPSFEKQKRIVKLLDNLSEVKNKKNEELKLCDTLIKARFVEMFGDPIINNKKLTEVPMTKICQIIDGDRGKNYPRAKDFKTNGYCLFLNTKNVTTTGFDFHKCIFISKERDELLHNGRLNLGDIVLTTRGTIGNLALYTEKVPYNHLRINSGMVILRMNHEKIIDKFFIEQFKMQLKKIKMKIASGSAQPQLPVSTMSKIPIVLPSIRKQEKYSDFVKQVDKSKLLTHP